MATAIKCPCGHKSCKNWLINPQAAYQGVSFTQEEAEKVAELLNAMAAPVGGVKITCECLSPGHSDGCWNA